MMTLLSSTLPRALWCVPELVDQVCVVGDVPLEQGQRTGSAHGCRGLRCGQLREDRRRRTPSAPGRVVPGKRPKAVGDGTRVHVGLEGSDLERSGAREVADKRHVDQVGKDARTRVLIAVARPRGHRAAAAAVVIAADRWVGARDPAE